MVLPERPLRHQSVLSSSRYFASTSFTCFKNCSSICRACGPAGGSSRSSASSLVDAVELVRAANLDLHHLGQRDEAPKVINRIIFTDFREEVPTAFVIEMIVVAVQEGGRDRPRTRRVANHPGD